MKESVAKVNMAVVEIIIISLGDENSVIN